jgi:hypothetical protein
LTRRSDSPATPASSCSAAGFVTPARPLRPVIVGDAHHVSTSKTIATIWTYAVASALLSLVIARWMGLWGT